MRVVIKDNEKNIVDYAKLKPGDCFRWDKDIYIKSQCDQEAISLTDGYALADMCGEMVTLINAEVHVID